MKIEERIEERKKIRAAITAWQTGDREKSTLLLISESLDDHLEHRIEADKVLEGILKDIQGAAESFAETNRAILAETRSILTENTD